MDRCPGRRQEAVEEAPAEAARSAALDQVDSQIRQCRRSPPFHAITADELVAFARAFDLPIGFFLTPPSAWDNHVIATPDAGPDGLEPVELFDVVIGTEENLAAWAQYLLSWPSPEHRIGLHDDDTIEHLGRVQDDVHPRLAGPAAVRAQLLLRQQFGDLDAARDVLARLIAALDDIAQPTPDVDDTAQQKPAPARGGRSAKR